MQYKVNEGEWKTIASGYTIRNLKDGDLVTACLYDGNSIQYCATLNVQEPIAISAEEIVSNPEKYYGQYVDYQPSNGDTQVKWKIFYAGVTPGTQTSNIYLIADNYISSTYVPNGKEGTSIEVGDTDYRLSIENIEQDYSGSSDITDNLIKLWLSYLNERSSSSPNMKGVAYMLDTNVWSGFKDSEGKAEYAVGGPTLDLFCASYNEKYPTTRLEYGGSNGNGYRVKCSTDSTWRYL